MKDHIYETYLDLGVIGEHKVEVFYDWHEGRTTNDRDEVPDPAGTTVIAVMAWIGGKEVDLFDYLNGDLLFDLEYECAENYRGTV